MIEHELIRAGRDIDFPSWRHFAHGVNLGWQYVPPYVRFIWTCPVRRRRAPKCADDAKKDPVLRDKPLLLTCQFEARHRNGAVSDEHGDISPAISRQPRHRVGDGVPHCFGGSHFSNDGNDITGGNSGSAARQFKPPTTEKQPTIIARLTTRQTEQFPRIRAE